MESIWTKTVNILPRKDFRDQKKVEVAVIGAGMAGLLTAYYLQRQGKQVVVLEANKIGSGQTKYTTAKITSQHNLIYYKLIQQFGEEKARQYAISNQKAILEYEQIIQEEQIDCEFKRCAAYLYSTTEVETLEREVGAARSLGIHAKFTTNTELPIDISGAVKFYEQAQFHPIKFLSKISEKLEIYENSAVNQVQENEIVTKRGTIIADHIIFTTHFPFINTPGYYFMRMHQQRSYVLALKHTMKLNNMYLGIDPDGLSFRSVGDFMLIGGGSHRTGETTEGGQYEMLRRKAMELWKNSKEEAYWSAQDCITMDGVPYIGVFSRSTPNWYVATGFGKWGMTSSMVSARILSDLILGIESPYAEVFSPKRIQINSDSFKHIVQDGMQTIKGLTQELFQNPKIKSEQLPIGHGGIVEIEGNKVGVYKEETGNIFLVSTKCPHLGCQLEWNQDEKSWDCPCHGSRFDYRGNLIDNPAQDNIKI